MKNRILLITASLVFVAVIYFYTQRVQPWYGRCAFGPTSDTSLEFIVLGDAVYLDRNIDGKAQSDELLPESTTLEVPSENGTIAYRIGRVGTWLAPSATSSDSPQVLDLYDVTGADFPYTMSGLVVLSRDRTTSDTCHFFGPLAIHVFPTDNFPPDKLFHPANEAIIKIGLISIDEASTAISPVLGPTSALVHTSAEPDRDTYAFDSTVRPELEIVFETTKTPSRQKLTIEEFC